MKLVNTLCVSCILLMYILMVSAKMVLGVGENRGPRVSGVGGNGGPHVPGVGDKGGQRVPGVGDKGGLRVPGVGDKGGQRVPGVGDNGGKQDEIQCGESKPANYTCTRLEATDLSSYICPPCIPPCSFVVLACCNDTNTECKKQLSLKPTQQCTINGETKAVCSQTKSSETQRFGSVTDQGATKPTTTTKPPRDKLNEAREKKQSKSVTPTKATEMSSKVSGLVIGLIAGLAGTILVAVIAVLVIFKVGRQKRGMTEDAEKSTPAGTASKDCQAGTTSNPYVDTGDDGYMDIDALDMPKNKPQDTELNNVSMDSPDSTVKDQSMNGQGQNEARPEDVVMVENGGYEGVGGDRSDDVAMVKNDDYEEFGEGNGTSDGVVMVDNADYEGIPSEGNGKADRVVMVENADYEGIPS